MRRSLLLLIIFLCAANIQVIAQSPYLTCDTIAFGNSSYSIHRNVSLKNIRIKNTQNHVRDSLIYKLGSNPREYFSYRTGYPMAIPMQERLDSVINIVFSTTEIQAYCDAHSWLTVLFALDPDTGETLEVEFQMDYAFDDNEIILSLPIERLHALEVLLKQRVVCFIPIEVNDAQMSYCTAVYSIFPYSQSGGQ